MISCCVSLFERYETSHENDGVSVEFADLEAFEVAYREIRDILRRPPNSQRDTSSYTYGRRLRNGDGAGCDSQTFDFIPAVWLLRRREGRAKPRHPQIFRQQRLAWRRGPDTPVPSAVAAGSRAVGRLWP